VDNSVNSIKVLKKNISGIKVDNINFQIVASDAMTFSIQYKNNFDLIFMDPPFNYPLLNELIISIFKNCILKEKGILVVEHEISNPVNFDHDLYEILKQKKIGRSLISFITERRSKSV